MWCNLGLWLVHCIICVFGSLFTSFVFFFFLNETAPPEFSPFPLHHPLPINPALSPHQKDIKRQRSPPRGTGLLDGPKHSQRAAACRSLGSACGQASRTASKPACR